MISFNLDDGFPLFFRQRPVFAKEGHINEDFQRLIKKSCLSDSLFFLASIHPPLPVG